MIIPFLMGAGLAFLGAIPVAGPVSALVLKLGLKRHSVQGWLFACGAALAESVYVLLAFFGFSVFLKSIPLFESGSRFLAGLILIALGLYFAFSKSASRIGQPDQQKKMGKRSAFFMGFMVSIVNPTLIASWTAIITSLYGYHVFQFSKSNAVAFSIGVPIGISSWFAVMLSIIHFNHHRFREEWIRRLIKTMGLILLSIGIYSFI
jgi:threonine/homoserine/homoserine lactone efflux protein